METVLSAGESGQIALVVQRGNAVVLEQTQVAE